MNIIDLFGLLLVIGGFAFAFFLAVALCKVAGKADDEADEYYYDGKEGQKYVCTGLFGTG